MTQNSVMAGPQPVLESGPIRLRQFRMQDAVVVRRLAGDPAVADTTLNVPHPYEEGIAEQWIATHPFTWESGEDATFAIELAGPGVLIGAINLSINQRFSRGEMGYWIGRKYWGFGYCTAAARKLVGFGFAEMRLHRIFARHLARNPASGRVMEKAGMRREGLLREHVLKGDRFEDVICYGALAAEWKPAGSNPA